MTLPKIVFLDAATFGDVSLERFGEIGDCKIYQITKPSETIGRLAGQDIAVTNKQPISEAALAAPESQLVVDRSGRHGYRHYRSRRGPQT